LAGAAGDEGSPFRLALVDVDLPDGTGLALARELASGGLGPVPAIVLTAPFSSRGVALKAQYEDGWGFLLRPVKERELAELVETMVGGRALPAAQRPAAAAPPAPAALRGRVLVAEDNEVNQMVLIRLLVERLGLRTDVVGSGFAAVEEALAGPYDLVLMDWQMPGMDGVEATREIRRREVPGRRVPIVGLTAHALAEHREQCLAAGMDDFLSKPVEYEALARVVARWAEAGAARRREPTSGAFERVALRLDEFVGRLGTESAWRIVDLFLQQVPENLASLRAALKRGGAEEVAREAHKLRGTCCHLGTERAMDFAGRVERRAERGDVPGAADAADDLEEELEGLAAFLDARRPPGRH
ncbi:MAG: response regulator, partial [Thermodesulfobacteriota bacterium]